VTAPAFRIIACAGALATGLLLGGTGVAMADTGETGGGVGTGSVPDPGPTEPAPEPAGVGAAGGSDDGGSDDDTNHPTSTIGNGRNDVVDPNAPIESASERKLARVDTPPKKTRPLAIPVMRIPSWEEVAAPGWTPPSAFFTTVEVPTLGEVLRTFSEPEPEPTPGPAFRTKEEAPVIDATPGGGGGGMDQPAAAADGPPALRAPLVVAPRIAPGVGRAPLGASAARGPSASPNTEQVAVGANTPLLRGTLAPSAVTGPQQLTPMSGQATRVGYPRYLRSPTVAELSAIALPGLAGLMLLTFGGGVIGYRQANSVRFVRTAGAERFLP